MAAYPMKRVLHRTLTTVVPRRTVGTAAAPSEPKSQETSKPQPGLGRCLGTFRPCSPAPFAGRVTAFRSCTPTAAEVAADSGP